MATSEGARSAIQALAGKVVGTRTLTVSEAWLNEERTSSSRGGEVPGAIPTILTEPPLERVL